MRKVAGRNKRTVILLILTVLIITAVKIFNIPELLMKQFYPVKYGEYVYKYARENGIDPFLVFAVIKAESRFNPNAVSRKNAKGLMQITDGTAEWGAMNLGMKDFEIEDIFDPEINIKIGCWYLGWLTRQFHDIDVVIAAYNSGNGNVSSWLRDRTLSLDGEKLDKIPFRETEQYLKKVRQFWRNYTLLYGK